MNYLLAKIKDRRSGLLKVMSIENDVFDMPDVSDNQVYSPAYKLEDGEWYKLDNFSSRGYGNDLIGSNLDGETFDSTVYNQITEQQYSKINYLCSKQGDFFLFQKMSSTRLLYKKWFYISGAPTLEIDKPIIILNSFVDAIYDINDDILYFRNIAKVKSMFKGIEELYREATQDEVDTFLEYDFISLDDTFTSNNVKPANRKRIAMAIDILDKFLYLFNWGEIPENDNGRLIEFMEQKCGIDWVKPENIEKIEGGNAINVSNETDSLSLRLYDENTKVKLIINNGRTYELIAKTENSKLNIYNQFTQNDKQQIFQYIQPYCGDVPVADESFLISTENNLKKILYGIEQRYYTTQFGNEKRLANSVLTLTGD